MTDAVTSFHSQLPVKIAFGDGVIAELPSALAALGATDALVVVEEPVAGHADVVAALAAAESAGVRLERFVKGPGEPTFALADELSARVVEEGLDAVVGIGGGSALDVAKAARIAARRPTTRAARALRRRRASGSSSARRPRGRAARSRAPAS
jgi:choline dehydrogenase